MPLTSTVRPPLTLPLTVPVTKSPDYSAVSSDSLIAANINNRGGQSMGLGVAMLALAAMPYPSRPEP